MRKILFLAAVAMMTAMSVQAQKSFRFLIISNRGLKYFL